MVAWHEKYIPMAVAAAQLYSRAPSELSLLLRTKTAQYTARVILPPSEIESAH